MKRLHRFTAVYLKFNSLYEIIYRFQDGKPAGEISPHSQSRWVGGIARQRGNIDVEAFACHHIQRTSFPRVRRFGCGDLAGEPVGDLGPGPVTDFDILVQFVQALSSEPFAVAALGAIERKAATTYLRVLAGEYASGRHMDNLPVFVTEMGRSENELRRVFCGGFKGLSPFNFSGGTHGRTGRAYSGLLCLYTEKVPGYFPEYSGCFKNCFIFYLSGDHLLTSPSYACIDDHDNCKKCRKRLYIRTDPAGPVSADGRYQRKRW